MRGAEISLKRKLLQASLGAGLLFSISLGSAFAQEAVTTRGWAHADFGRLVFDWPSQVEYRVEATDSELIIRFDRPLQSDLANALEKMAPYLAAGQITEDGQAVSFQLRQPVRTSSFTNENSVVIDLRPGEGAAVPQTASQAPALRVRVGEHPTYNRLVFDWTAPVTYQTAKDGNRYSLSFSRPARIDLNAVRSVLPAGLTDPQSSTTPSDSSFSLSIPPGSNVRHFKSGEKVVVDILKPDPNQPAQPEPQAVATAPVEVVEEVTPEEAPISLAPPPADDGATPSEETVTPEETGPETAEVAESTEGTAAEETAGAGQEVTSQQDGAEAPLPEGEAATVDEELTEEERAARAAAEAAAEAERLRIEAEDEAARKLAEEGSLNLKRPGDLSVRGNEPEDIGPAPVSLVFRWPENVGAAAYRRGGNIWIVFDKKSTGLDTATLQQMGQPLIQRVQQMPNNVATVIKLEARPGVNPIARREGFDWVFDFRRKPIKPRNQISIQAETDEDIGPHLLFPTSDPGSLIPVRDNDIRDTLQIATYKDPGFGVRGARVYPEFTILPSAQGLVIQSAIDNLLLDRDLNGFQLTSPEGLHISGISPEAPVTVGLELSSRRLFDLSRWKRGEVGDYLEAEQALYRAVTEVPPEKLNDARLDLARFYVARERGPEAVGVLKVVESEDPSVAAKPAFRALRGAAKFLNRDYTESLRDFNDPRLNGFAETAIWRGAALAMTDQWKEAEVQFRAGDSLLTRYPNPLRVKLALIRVRSAEVARDARKMSSWLTELDKDPDALRPGQLAEMRYQQARVAASDSDFDTAALLWQELADGDDWKYSVWSQYALTLMNLKQGLITKQEAAETLDSLSYQWRGDAFEFQILRKLGEIHIEDNDYMSGLGVMRTAVKYFRDKPISKSIRAKMVDIFRELYLEGGADKLPPLRALAIYEEFRELTPSGPDGDILIEKMADRLIAVDLLGRAAKVLERQVKSRLQGEERSRVGAKLALIRLLDGDPQGAIQALNGSVVSSVERELEDDRRRLRSKANFENGDISTAIKLLAGDISIEADMLRRDIYWNQENWAEVAKVLQRLAGDPPEEAELGMDDDKARFVLNWAVALLLNSDDDGIALLNDLYGDAMANSSLASTYRFVATPVQSGNTEKLQDTIQQLANSDMFNAFMNNYRDKLLSGPEKEAEENQAQPPATTDEAPAGLDADGDNDGSETADS